MSTISEVNGLQSQPVLPIADPQAYAAVHSSIEACFSSPRVESFLKSLSGLRIRDFETILTKNLLGKTTKADYATLQNADQGQIREFYLASLERVTPELRQKFFKLYSYY